MTPEEAGDRCAPRYWQRGKGGNGRPIEAQTSRNWTSHTPTLTKTEEHPLLSQGIHPLQGDFFSCHYLGLASLLHIQRRDAEARAAVQAMEVRLKALDPVQRARWSRVASEMLSDLWGE